MAAQKKETKITENKKRDQIGVIFYGNPDTADFFKAVYIGVEVASAGLPQRPELVLKYSPMNAIEQIKDLEKMVNIGVKGIVISPIDDPMVVSTIKNITSRGIPVVTVHTDLPDSGRLAYVGTDPYKAGQVAGEQMAHICEEGTEIGIVTGSRNILGHEQRVRGFVDYITKNRSDLIIEYIGECHDDDYKAYELVQKMESDHPGISAVFFATTGGIYGGCKGLFTMTTRLRFHVVTLDVFVATREFMQKGLIDCSVYQSPKQQGFDAMSILTDKLYNGKVPDKQVNYEELSIKTKECLYL